MKYKTLETSFSDTMQAPVGKFELSIFDETVGMPIDNAVITIRNALTNEVVNILRSDSSGQTPQIELATPPLEFSTNVRNDKKPYAEYNIDITSRDFVDLQIKDVQIFPSTRDAR
jgi:hypothetical protein